MTFPTVRGCLALVLAEILGGLAAVAFFGPSVGEAAASTTYSLTVAGTDAHSLSPGFQPMFVDGGGVQANAEVDADASQPILEAAVSLPVGARVTSIAVSYSGCDQGAAGTYVFGSYAPASRATAQVLRATPAETCSPKTFTKTGSPITTVAAGRRYVIDWLFSLRIVGGPRPPTVDTFYGATVKYTCTAPCVP
jgi:hypothetical protein